MEGKCLLLLLKQHSWAEVQVARKTPFEDTKFLHIRLFFILGILSCIFINHSLLVIPEPRVSE